ncbi:MAG TPA: EAL domain-containing protein [Acidimicrobiales bacterium]
MVRGFSVATRTTVTVLAGLLVLNAPLMELIDHRVADLVFSVAPSAVAAFAAFACVVAGRRSTAHMRRGWFLFAIAAVAWAFGHFGDGGNNTLPLRLVATASAGLAVVQWLRPALNVAGCVRVAADGLVIGASLVFLAWPTVFQPLIARNQPGIDHLVALVPPFGDVSVLALVIVCGARLRAGSRQRWALLAGSLVLVSLGDGAFAYLRIERLLHAHGVNQWAWTVGAACLALAALAPSGEATPLAQEPRPTRGFHVLLSYAPFVIAAAEATARLLSGRLDEVSIAIAVGLGGLLFLRQLVAQFETLHFTHQLDGLVRERTAELHRQERTFRSLVQHASDVLTVVDGELTIRYQSAAAERLFGVAPDGPVGLSLAGFVHHDDIESFRGGVARALPPPALPEVVEARMRRPDATWAVTETTVSNLLDEPGVEGLLLTTRDVSERKRLEEQLRHEALHDPLTGLANRVLFHSRLEHAAALASRNPHTIAVLAIDLDGFKSVNDTLGHAAGDRLLTEVAARLAAAVRPGDTVARMGGDEFAILVERADPETAETIAGRVLTLLRMPFDVDGRTVVPSGSVGVAVGLTNRLSGEELLQAADLAMYTAKTSGKGRYEVFEEGMHEAALLRMELETDLRRALRDGEMVLHFQPIVELPSGRMSGVEALIRWQHPRRGLLSPSDFIEVAEESDLIAELGRWVLKDAARHVQVWEQRYGIGRFDVSVNIAARQLLTPWLVDEVAAVLHETGIAPQSLLLEITEGALMSDKRPIDATLNALKALGVRLAIDDFGTGWSSLSRLRDFPVDKLKIDRAFVREINAPDQDVPLVGAIVAMAQSLGLGVVAEGVETLEQLACLHGLGVEEVQGFLLAKPLTAVDLEALLEHPDGLVDGPDEPAHAALERPDNSEFLGLVTSAALEAPDASTVRAMLHELQRVAGLDSVYLTAFHPERQAQEIKTTANNGRLAIPASMVTPWPNSPCAVMVAGGPRCTRDLAQTYPRHALARFGGVRGHITVPVYDGSGNLFGTLCGASPEPLEPNVSLVRLFDLFAALVTRNRFGTPVVPPRSGREAGEGVGERREGDRLLHVGGGA